MHNYLTHASFEINIEEIDLNPVSKIEKSNLKEIIYFNEDYDEGLEDIDNWTNQSKNKGYKILK
jgi:hypothetical protein